MLLKNKTAVIYGAGGAIGGAVARAFAKEGAKVFLTGRNLTSVAATATEIVAAGGTAEAAEVDALDEGAVEDHISDTPVPQPGTQGIAIAQLSTVSPSERARECV